MANLNLFSPRGDKPVLLVLQQFSYLQ